MALALPHGWIDEMKRAGTLATRGVPGAALRILDQLYGDVRAAGRDAVGDWHRIQILWIKATILDEAGRYSDAARVYETIVRFRRAQMEEAGRGLLSSLVAAAACKGKSGHRQAAARLARQAQQLLERYPDAEAERALTSNPTLWARPATKRTRGGASPRPKKTGPRR